MEPPQASGNGGDGMNDITITRIPVPSEILKGGMVWNGVRNRYNKRIGRSS